MNAYLYRLNQIVRTQPFACGASRCSICLPRALQRLIKETTQPEPMWTCGDGKRIPVKSMTDSHLFFAIAKAFRDEYPDSKSRADGVAALKAEAARRLA